jgi:hypothetical protein
MFETVLGLPAHPLLLHATVVFVPLLALGAIAYAVVPHLRRRIRWEVALLALIGAGSVVVTRLSGDAFKARSIRKGQVSPQGLAQINQHRTLGITTMWYVIALAAVTLVLLYLLAPAGARLAAGGTAAGGTAATARPAVPRILGIVVAVAAVGLAIVSLYYVYRTGDLGAHMVWSGR